jgi:DNA-binding IclR family transcriptional regulator
MIDDSKGGGAYRVRAVQRAMDVLDALGEAREPQELAVLSRQVGLHPSTTLRMLVTLRGGRMVRQSRDGWLLGARVFELGNSFVRGDSIWSRGGELVERLAGQSDATSSLGILEHGEVLYIAIAHGQGELGIQSSPGTRHPAHATALGKMLLAMLPWPEAEALVGPGPLAQLTANTVTGIPALRVELETIAKRGYSVDAEERAPGVTCIAAPIRDHSGDVVAAISLSGPTFRIQGTMFEGLREMVVTHADDASDQLGARASFDPSPSPVPR